jgi:hypothetical protein
MDKIATKLELIRMILANRPAQSIREVCSDLNALSEAIWGGPDNQQQRSDTPHTGPKAPSG